MSITRRDPGTAWRERIAIWAMAAGVCVLGAALVAVFVLVPVFLLKAPRARTVEAEAARAPEKPVAVKPPPPPAPPPKPMAEMPREIPAIDEEGFIRHWLVLASIPAAKELAGLAEIHRQQIRNEARLRPREGEKARASGQEYVWRAHRAPEYFVDFRRAAGEGRGEDAVAYAVCYVIAPSEMKGLRLTMGSNDQGRVYLNGAPLIQFDKSRVLAKDSEVANDVALRRGENLLVFKVVNEKNNWQGCVRFTDKAGNPVRNLQISLGPQ